MEAMIKEKVNVILSRHSGKKDELIPILQETQEEFGYLPAEAMQEIARFLKMSEGTVFSVASFYSLLSLKPLGRNIIRVCKSLPCYLKHAEMIIESIAKELAIRPGETTPDGRFSLQLSNCIGLCDRAPAMMINHEVFGDLTLEKIVQILKKYQ